MNDQPFGRVYADQYDLLYRDKDYEAECNLLEEAFRRYGDGNVQTVLDLGCGTGNHAIPLAKRGYKVTGADRSEFMLDRARAKTSERMPAAALAAPVFHAGDIRTLELGQTFDAVLMMFAVLGYQLSNSDIMCALRTVRRHLRPRGLFVCDVWYGPAILKIGPSDKLKVVPTEGGEIIRVASGELNVPEHLCDVHYRLWRIEGQRVESRSEELHRMRFFFPQELAFYFECAGLKLVGLTAFGDPDRHASDQTWNVLAVAERATDDLSSALFTEGQ